MIKYKNIYDSLSKQCDVRNLSSVMFLEVKSVEDWNSKIDEEEQVLLEEEAKDSVSVDEHELPQLPQL